MFDEHSVREVSHVEVSVCQKLTYSTTSDQQHLPAAILQLGHLEKKLKTTTSLKITCKKPNYSINYLTVLWGLYSSLSDVLGLERDVLSATHHYRGKLWISSDGMIKGFFGV